MTKLKAEEAEEAEEAVSVLKDISEQVGYHFIFENVDVWIEDKEIRITGNKSSCD